MENDELYDEVQETKTAFVITLLIAIYCFSVILKSIAVHKEWKVVCCSAGFAVVSAIAILLFVRLFKLNKAAKEILDESK